MRRILRWLFTALLIGLATGPQPARAQDGGDLIARVNNLRASVGQPAYSYNGALAAAAQQQAQWIVDTGNVSHTRPDGSGPRTRAINAGYASTQVSENIYGGTNASVDSAWNFWLNSAIHYAGLTNPNYRDVGAGIARGAWGSAYVLVFGNPGGPAPAVAAQAAAAVGSSGSQPAAPPSFIVGVDGSGNIMHEVQPGDTLGDIALIYGYTWDDLPAMMALNQITDVRDLDIGSVFLVPPKGGTYTPTPGGPTETPTPIPTTATPTPLPPSITPFVVTTPTRIAVATVGAAPELFAEGETPSGAVAMAVTIAPELITLPAGGSNTAPSSPRGGSTPLIVLAIALQIAVVVAAGFEYVRRSWRRKRRP